MQLPARFIQGNFYSIKVTYEKKMTQTCDISTETLVVIKKNDKKRCQKKRGTSSHARLASFNSLISSNNKLWLGRKQVTCYKIMEPMYVQKRAEIGWLRASMNTTSDSKIRIYTIRQLELSLSRLFNKTTRKRILVAVWRREVDL